MQRRKCNLVGLRIPATPPFRKRQCSLDADVQVSTRHAIPRLQVCATHAFFTAFLTSTARLLALTSGQRPFNKARVSCFSCFVEGLSDQLPPWHSPSTSTECLGSGWRTAYVPFLMGHWRQHVTMASAMCLAGDDVNLYAYSTCADKVKSLSREDRAPTIVQTWPLLEIYSFLHAARLLGHGSH